jgi:hypothetical protein
MIKPGLAFAGTSSYTNFRTSVRVLLYGDVVHVSSCSLVHVHWHEREATVMTSTRRMQMQGLIDN